jgi:hypothetical protein
MCQIQVLSISTFSGRTSEPEITQSEFDFLIEKDVEWLEIKIKGLAIVH